MPVFNHPTELKVMIDSILANNYKDWELLAIDDGSDKDTLDILQQYAAADDRIHFVKRELAPKGAQTCRNIGLQMARGEFICFFDADDAIAPYCLEQRIAELTTHPELDFMVFRSSIYGHDELKQDDYKNMYGYGIYKDDIAAFCARTLPFIVWNNIYRRTSLEKYNICWDTNLLSLQDAQFNLHTLLAGMRYAYSDKPADYYYRIDTLSSVSKNIYSEAHFISNLHAIQSFYEQINPVYGKRYNHALYQGALFVNLKITREHFSKDFSTKLAKIVYQYSPAYGILFHLQIILTWILLKFLPYKIARQIPMFPYLIGIRYRERKWFPKLIKAKLAMILLSACALVSCVNNSISSRDHMYTLSWQDEFNAQALDTTLWSWIPRQSARCFCNLTTDEHTYAFSDSTLRLYALYNDSILPQDTATFLTAGIWSQHKATFTYGKIMLRARIHGAVGIWPAVWTMTDDERLWNIHSPQYTEIDILEYVYPDDFVYQTAHNAYTLAHWRNRRQPQQQNLSKVNAEEFNIYSIEILHDEVIFGINNKETFRYPRCQENDSSFFYGLPSQLIMDMQIYPPSSWSHGVDSTTFPAFMEFDWVRVYKLKE